MKGTGNVISMLLWMVAIGSVFSMLSGCATTQQEADMNTARQNSFIQLNQQKTYTPVKMTGITSMTGDITIETMAETRVTQVPDLQYDTSRNDLISKAIGAVERVTLGGVAGATAWMITKEIGDAVRQPEPIVVRPEVVKVPEGATVPDPVIDPTITTDPVIDLPPSNDPIIFFPPGQ